MCASESTTVFIAFSDKPVGFVKRFWVVITLESLVNYTLWFQGLELEKSGVDPMRVYLRQLNHYKSLSSPFAMFVIYFHSLSL